jgi:hypothetical protein
MNFSLSVHGNIDIKTASMARWDALIHPSALAFSWLRSGGRLHFLNPEIAPKSRLLLYWRVTRNPRKHPLRAHPVPRLVG